MNEQNDYMLGTGYTVAWMSSRTTVLVHSVVYEDNPKRFLGK